MFKIDTQNNRISPVNKKLFSEVGFTERNNLQEWIAHTPQALGEDLLIIQKEFDGFDDTRERLDLLALDKAGNLVIIENKLDDSGRDVAWQALKYASYCSNLSKRQVVEIYQRFLKQSPSKTDSEPLDAVESIAEFLEVDDLDEVIINSGQSQRIIFVAAKFRKEVTNTVLWLIGHGISCQCFKTTLYEASDELFLNIEQIIPTPESKEFMISMVSKEAEEKATGDKLKDRHHLRLDFWAQVLEALGKSECHLFSNINPSKDNWVSAGSGISAMTYELVFGKQFARVGLYIGKKNADENSAIFQTLLDQKEKIEKEFGNALEWTPLPEKKGCRIKYEKAINGYDQQNWPEIISWMVEYMGNFEKAIQKPLQEIKQSMKH